MVFRKILIGFSLIFATFLTSCNDKEAERPNLAFDYVCMAEVTVDNDVYKTQITKNGSGFSFEFTYPAELEGMVVEIENESYKTTYHGLEQIYDRDCVPDSAVCDFLASSLEYITYGKGIVFTNEGDVTKGTGVLDGGDFTVSYNQKSLPDFISIGKEITIDFSDFKKT